LYMGSLRWARFLDLPKARDLSDSTGIALAMCGVMDRNEVWGVLAERFDQRPAGAA
jgi:hypothetical protein